MISNWLSAALARRNIHYGWAMVGVTFLTGLISAGTVGARVERITADAVTDEKIGSYYPAVLTLERDSMVVDGRNVKISPGMTISAEIKTGYRSVMEYLLSPIQRAGHEGLRER